MNLRFLAVLLMLPLSTSVFGSGDRDWPALYGDEIHFDVFRKGERIGDYTTRFTETGGALQVDVRMTLSIPILFGWHYDYRYTATEVWRAGELARLEVEIDDDGDPTRLSAESENGVLRGSFNQDSVTVATPILPTHHYNADVLGDSRVFNTLTGKENSIEVIDQGDDVIVSEQGTLQARRYSYTGDLTDTEVWYDREERWVKMVFLGSDGVPIELRCLRCEQ